MSRFIIFCFVILSSLGGFYLGYRANPADQGDEKISSILRSNSGKLLNRSLDYSMGVSTEILRKRTPHLTSVRKGLDQIQQTPKDKRIAEVLGNDEIGRELSRTLSAAYHPGEIPGSGIYVDNFLKNLKRDPAHAMTMMNRVLEQMPASEFPLERSSALHVIAQLPGYSEVAHDKALNEITSYSPNARPDPTTVQTPEEKADAMNTSFAIMLPTSAHQIFIDTSNNAEDALNGTVRAIEFQQDTGIRIALEVQYLRKFPSMTSQLLDKMTAQNITLPQWANDHIARTLAMGDRPVSK